MGKHTQALEQALGGNSQNLEFLASLDDAAQQQLVADIAQAKQAYRKNIENSLDEALNHIPRLLRGPIKKLFGR